jgi:hypothetical protein
MRENCPHSDQTRSAKKARDDAFLLGVLVALGCVYAADEETTAQEIVSAVGAASLVRVAKAEDDPYLPNLRKTIRFLRSIRIGSAQ